MTCGCTAQGELHAAPPADHPQQVQAAVQAAAQAPTDPGRQVLGQQPSPVLGAKGAVEAFLHARSWRGRESE